MRLFILFYMATQLNAFAGPDISSKKCGDFYVVESNSTMNESTCLGNGLYTDEQNYKTPDSQVLVFADKEIFKLTNKSQEIIDYVLYQKVLQKVKERFSEAFEFAKESKEPELLKALKDAEKELFQKDSKNPKKETQKILSLFPDIEDEILEETPDYKPLICQYQARKHREKNLRKFSRVLSAIGMVGGLSGIIAAGIINIPMMPVAFYALSFVKMSSGTLKIRNAVANWNEVQSAKVAKRLLKVFDQAKKELDSLEEENKTLNKLHKTKDADALIVENNERISSLKKGIEENNFLMKDLRSQIKSGKRIKRELISGAIDTSLGAFAFWGGNFSSKQLANFYPKESQINTIKMDPKGDGSFTSYGPDDLQGPGVTYVDP
jgi:hypothetical protein